jgi:hypothetical protein
MSLTNFESTKKIQKYLTMKTKSFLLTTVSILFVSVYCWGQQANEAPTISFDKIDINCHGESTGAIVGYVEGGHPPYSLSWSNGEEGESIYNLSPGFYTLTVTDAEGTMNSRVTEITEPDQLNILATVVHPSASMLEDGEIAIEIQGGSPFKWTDTPYLFDWNHETTSLDQLNIGAGTYTLSISDRNGCSTQESFVLSALAPMVDSWVEIEQFHSVSNGNIVYPNPSNVGDIVSMNYDQESVRTITILSAQGTIVNTIIPDSSGQLNLHQLEKGIYIIQFTTDYKQSESIRMVVQ